MNFSRYLGRTCSMAAVLACGLPLMAGSAVAASWGSDSGTHASQANGSSSSHMSANDKIGSGPSGSMSKGGMSGDHMSKDGMSKGSVSGEHMSKGSMSSGKTNAMGKPWNKTKNNTANNKMVKKVQQALNKAGAQLKVDGHMGPNTKRALLNYQSSHNLPTTGKIDQATKKSLGLG